MPKLSIVMPTFNGAPYLAQQIGSILDQDDPDFELLVIDDGSSDQTASLATGFAARDPRVRILPSVGRAGQANRLRALIEASAGDFVAVADQDDIWLPDRNRLLLAAIGDGAMALGRSELIDGAGARIGTSLLQQLHRRLAADVRLRALFLPMFSGHATIVRRNAIDMGAFHSSLTFDWLMAVDAIFSRGLVYVDEAVVLHRIHGGNQLNNLNLGKSRRRVSSAFLRDVLLHQSSSRLHFWLVLGHLGRSSVLAPDDRALFAHLAGRCYVTWFSHWRSIKPINSSLRRELKDDLRRFAGSTEDEEAFERQVDILTAPILSRSGLAETARRWRIGP